MVRDSQAWILWGVGGWGWFIVLGLQELPPNEVRIYLELKARGAAVFLVVIASMLLIL